MEELPLIDKLFDHYGAYAFGTIVFIVIVIVLTATATKIWRTVVQPLLNTTQESGKTLVQLSENIERTSETQKETALINKEISTTQLRCLEITQEIIHEKNRMRTSA